MPKKNKRSACKLGTRYVEWIHDDLIGTVWPDIDPVAKGESRDISVLESALARPLHSAGGQDAYPSAVEKASALFHSLISNHPFQNGNKRTAVIAVDAFLMGNGYALATDNDKTYELAHRTASYKQRGVSHDNSLLEITKTLRDFSLPLQQLYSLQKKDKQLSALYRGMIAIRRAIRRNSGNQLVLAS